MNGNKSQKQAIGTFVISAGVIYLTVLTYCILTFNMFATQTVACGMVALAGYFSISGWRRKREKFSGVLPEKSLE